MLAIGMPTFKNPYNHEPNRKMFENFTIIRFGVYITMFAVTSLAQTTAASLAPGDSVLSVDGMCGEAKDVSLTSGDCTVVAISRAQFEDLLSVLSPQGKAAPVTKDSLAKAYADLLAFDHAAKDLGIDSSPQYQATMQWLAAKTLADLLRRRLEKESAVVSEAEAQAYYHDHISEFEEVRLRRLVLPKDNFTAADKLKFEHDMQPVAAGLRTRAADGEDMERLQKEGYEALGLGGLPPATDVGYRRRAALPSEDSEEIFSLRPGDVSKVENETYSLVIYKVESKRRLAPEQVKEEIHREVAREKLERSLRSITGNIRTKLNEQYFGTISAQ